MTYVLNFKVWFPGNGNLNAKFLQSICVDKWKTNEHWAITLFYMANWNLTIWNLLFKFEVKVE